MCLATCACAYRCTTELPGPPDLAPPSPAAASDGTSVRGPLDMWPPSSTYSPLRPAPTDSAASVSANPLRTPPPDLALEFSPSLTNATESIDFAAGFPSDLLSTRMSGAALGTAGDATPPCMPSPMPLSYGVQGVCDPWYAMACDPWCEVPCEPVYCEPVQCEPVGGCVEYYDCAWQQHC